MNHADYIVCMIGGPVYEPKPEGLVWPVPPFLLLLAVCRFGNYRMAALEDDADRFETFLLALDSTLEDW